MKTYIKPQTNEEQLAIDAVCLVVSTTPADSSPVLSPERDDNMEWEEF